MPLGARRGGAVQRNRLRRQLRHIVRSCDHSLRPGWYLVGVSAGVNGLTYQQMEATLSRLLVEVQQ
ncbi:MAG: ribonuclease P protein component [Ilumatobacteraceae bacterium]